MPSPLLVAVTMIAFVCLGREIAIRRWHDRAGPLELWSAAFCLGAALWIASVWVLALLQVLNQPAIMGRTLLVVVVAAGCAVARLRGGGFAAQPRNRVTAQPITILASIPLLGWIAYIAWRTMFLPPLSHDALAYHLPRAVLWIRNGGYRFIDLPIDARVRLLPANYEMLLADVMLLGKGDALTEWIAVFFFIAFVVACGALAKRWWGGRVAPFATMLLSASVPVLLLHTGADKNDVMVAFFMVSALVWAGRWLSGRELTAAVMCVIALAAAIGTKPQGVMLAVCLVPLFLWRTPLKTIAKLAAISIVAIALLGGPFYLSRITNHVEGGFVAYDDWVNLVQAPWVVLTAPMSPWHDQLFVPWSTETWFWRRDEIYFSHLGVAFAVCVLLLPWTIVRFRQEMPERRGERFAIALAALATAVLMLPVRDIPMPHGIYVAALARYVLFLVPVVFALSAAPVIRALAETDRRQADVVLLLLAGWFVWQSLQANRIDRFVPPRYVAFARDHPGTRVIPFDDFRAGSVASRLAKENERIAVDAGYGAWIHPAFGASLQRPVTFLRSPAEIPGEVRLVAIDRGWHMIWQQKEFRDLSQWQKYLGRGRALEEDTRVMRALLRDPRWELIYFRRTDLQAVFRRR